MILAHLCPHGFQKIPFACSYLPGKANVHVTSAGYVMILLGLTAALRTAKLCVSAVFPLDTPLGG